MKFEVIAYNSSDYEQMIALRQEVLRKPLGLTFTQKDLEKDKDDLLLVCRRSDIDEVSGCCVLTSLTPHTVQLRQMAVDDKYRGKGLGSQLLAFAEKMAIMRHYNQIYLHARKVAVDFYKKQGYQIEGEPFVEVGIQHFEMRKQIQKQEYGKG